jgi:hypothetical protein
MLIAVTRNTGTYDGSLDVSVGKNDSRPGNGDQQQTQLRSTRPLRILPPSQSSTFTCVNIKGIHPQTALSSVDDGFNLLSTNKITILYIYYG